MDPTLKEKWLEALRSGEYRQGRGKLYRPDHNSYCCLGVLCTIAGLKHKDGHFYSSNGIGSSAFMPPSHDVDRWGLSDKYVDILTCKNDDGTPFIKIADYIEENL